MTLENNTPIPANSNTNPLRNIERFAKILDSQFTIPGTKIKFGIDPILSLLPSLGTYIGFAFGSYLIIEGIRKGAKGKVILKMIGNNVLDFVIGLIPGIGFVFDFVYKSNIRNVTLLREYFHEGKHQGNALGYWLLLILCIVGFFALSIYLVVKIFYALEKFILLLLP